MFFSSFYFFVSSDEFLNMTIEDKRKLYKCKTNYVELDTIPCWPEYFNANIKDDPESKSWWKSMCICIKQSQNHKGCEILPSLHV